jgi:hypothetical protein
VSGPTPPSTQGALAGALICCNLSASNIVIGKARERMMLAASQSARAVCAYVYSAAGPGESTTDIAWDPEEIDHDTLGLIVERQQPLGIGKQHFPRFGRHQPAPGFHEQLAAKLRFQPP